MPVAPVEGMHRDERRDDAEFFECLHLVEAWVPLGQWKRPELTNLKFGRTVADMKWHTV